MLNPNPVNAKPEYSNSKTSYPNTHSLNPNPKIPHQTTLYSDIFNPRTQSPNTLNPNTRNPNKPTTLNLETPREVHWCPLEVHTGSCLQCALEPGPPVRGVVIEIHCCSHSYCSAVRLQLSILTPPCRAVAMHGMLGSPITSEGKSDTGIHLSSRVHRPRPPTSSIFFLGLGHSYWRLG